MRSLFLRVMRNLFCGSLAQLLVRSGYVRRAMNRAFSGDAITAIYFHRPSQKLFEKCIAWLIQNGYSFLSADELIELLNCGKPFPPGAVWLSLDDGYREWLTDLLPVIRRHRVPVTLFIPSGIVCGDGKFPWLRNESRSRAVGGKKAEPARDSLTVSELRQIAARPEIQIGSHTVNHAVTVQCTDERLQFEIAECKQLLELWTASAVRCFSYPEGRYDGREVRFLRESAYAMAVTTEARFIARDTDPFLVPRFCVPDNVTFAEAICNMVGVWHPVLEPIKTFFRLRAPATSFPGEVTARMSGGLTDFK